MPTTVDKIRRALEKRDGIAEEEMRPLAESYRHEVQEVNQRLDDAVMLLRKGLRSEAIQRVEMTPNALDAAADLEFPEWDEWNEILQFMAIPLPPQLNQDYVAQINEAIIESLPLDALLRRHRRLAIAKAPLAIRLRTLRQISRVDATNTVWQDDVETWEKARLSQIDNELKNALDKEDSQQLFQLHKELTAGPWRVAPSPRLIEQTSFAAEAHVRQNLETELNKLAPQLNKALESQDEAKARAVRSQWQAVRARFSVSVPDHLEMSVAPAMQWLEDLDRQAVMESEREMAVANLQTTLEAESPIEDVQAAYDQATRFGQPVPEELSDRVKKLAEKPAKKQKQKLILIGAVAAVVIAAAVTGLVIYSSSAGKKTAQEQTINQMEQFVAAEQFDEALSFFNSVLTTQPEVAQLPKMVAMKAVAQKAVDKNTQRIELFEKRYAQANNDDPALIDEILLPQLEELASNSTQLALVEDLRKRKAEYVSGEKLRQSDEMIGKVSEYQNQFAELARRGGTPGNQQAMRTLLSSIIRLPKQYPLATDDALARQETLRARVGSEIDSIKQMQLTAQQLTDAIDSLRNSRDLNYYADRLRRFSTESVSHTDFIDFAQVIDEEDHWSNVEATNRWLETFGSKLKSGLTSTEAASLIESADILRADASPNPAFLAMPEFSAAMKEIVGRRIILDGGFTRISKHPLTRLVELPIEDSESPTGTTNYLVYKTFVEQNASRMKRSGSIGVSVVSDSLGGVRNRGFQGPLPDVTDEPMQSVTQIAGQKSKMTISFDQKWEQTFMVLVSDVMKRPNLDGITKEWLIYQLLDTATRGSSRLKDMIPLTMRTLERRSSVRENWFEPRQSGSKLNPELERILRKELNVAYARFANPLEEFESIASKRLTWLGFLTKSPNGKIEYHVRGTLPEFEGTLYVAGPSREGDADTSLFAVGTLKQGHVQLIPNPVHQVPGRPLFLFPD